MICGAKNRLNEPCKKWAIKGKARCANHGGLSKGGGAPKGNKNAIKHGIYSSKLSSEEMEDFKSIELGSVDDELLLMRILLARELDKEAKEAGKPELKEVIKNEGGGFAIPSETRKSKVKDYDVSIEKIIGRIESLEKTRLLLDNGGAALGKEISGFEVVPYIDGDEHE